MYIPDIYRISDTVNEIQRKYMKDLNEDTLFMGIYGYMNEIFSNNIQDTIITATEWGNEAFPIRSKFEKTILTNAITYNVNNINATPAKMTVMLGFIKRELDQNMVKDTFVLDKDCKIMVGDFEYHLDYDLIITKDHLIDNVYSARYDMERKNIISEVTNPYSYLEPPIILKMDNDDFVFITCTIRQVELVKLYKKIISNNMLENKTFDFSFDKQLASFDVKVTEGNKTTYLTPIFEGMPLNGKAKYCFYSYIDKNTIRVKFDRGSYEPKINCNVEIIVQNTKGDEGNFIYKDDIIVSLQSEKINYKGMSMLVKPVTSSVDGINRKSMKELKEIIPKEILSRGNITNNKDLENFFNMMDYNNRLMFYRRRDNQIERLYYAYMLVKDNDNNVIPTNTINLRIPTNQFDYNEDGRYILNPGKFIEYDPQSENGTIATKEINKDKIYENESKGFIYSSPFTIVVNKDPLCASYYLSQINRDYKFKFTYINNTSLQFISSSIHCYRNYINSPNYKLTTHINQTMNVDKNLVRYTDNGIDSSILPVLVISIDKYKYYVKGKITSFNRSTFRYDVEFELESNNMINAENKIRIDNVYSGGTSDKTYIYADHSIKMAMYVLVKFDNNDGIINDLGEIEGIVPGLKGYTLCNKYDTIEPVDLFFNYSNIIKSKVSLIGKKDDNYIFDINSSPVVRYSYLDDIERCNNILSYIQYRKAYIDSALNVIENSFTVDLKFFNTYGPSRMFKIGHNNERLDKVNLSLKFKIHQYAGSDKHTKEHIIYEIKEYIENINDVNNKIVSITNLTTDIMNKFKSDIKYIEFVGINNYNSLYQYLEKTELNIIDQVPEFLNINLTEDLKPDIDIELV